VQKAEAAALIALPVLETSAAEAFNALSTSRSELKEAGAKMMVTDTDLETLRCSEQQAMKLQPALLKAEGEIAHVARLYEILILSSQVRARTKPK